MKNGETLGKKLTRLREGMDWTVYEACEYMPNVGRQSLIRIESGEAEPRRVSMQTLFDLLYVYYPELALEDFTDDPELKRFSVVRRRALAK